MNKSQFIKPQFTKTKILDTLDECIKKETDRINECFSLNGKPASLVVPKNESDVSPWITRWQRCIDWYISDFIIDIETLRLLIFVRQTINDMPDKEIKSYLTGVKNSLTDENLEGVTQINRSSSESTNLCRNKTLNARVAFVKDYLSSPFGLLCDVIENGVKEE